MLEILLLSLMNFDREKDDEPLKFLHRSDFKNISG